MPHVAALYRYPVKGFTHEACESLAILPDGRTAGDRVLGFRFANCVTADDAWSSKHEFVALVNTPALARIALRFDHERQRLRLALDGAVLADEALDARGRERLAAAVQEYALAQAVNPLRDHPDRLPLRLVGDGITPRFQDNADGHTTLHGRASVAALARHMGLAHVDELRFRSNIAVDGLEAWEEQRWMGQRVTVGGLAFDTVKAKTRCLATHAHPNTGARDLNIMAELMRAYPGQPQPTLGVGLRVCGPGGRLRVGDPVGPATQAFTSPPAAN